MTVTANPSASDALSVTPDWSPDGRTCHHCGTPLARNITLFGEDHTLRYRLGAKYCSNACRQSAYRQRKAEP